MRKAALDTEDEHDEQRKMQEIAIKDDPGWIMAVTRGQYEDMFCQVLASFNSLQIDFNKADSRSY